MFRIITILMILFAQTASAKTGPCHEPIEKAVKDHAKKDGVKDTMFLDGQFSEKKPNTFEVMTSGFVGSDFLTIIYEVDTELAKNKKSCRVTKITEAKRRPHP